MRERRARLAALLATAAALAPRQPLRRRRTRLRATNDPITTKNPTLTRWLLDHTRKNPQQEDLEALLSSIAMGCKTISGIVQRAGAVRGRLPSPAALRGVLAGVASFRTNQ